VTKEPQHNAHGEALGFVAHPNLRALQGVVQGFPRPQGEGVVRVLDGIDLHIEKLEHLHAFGPLGGGSIHGPYWFIMFGKGEL
jgi:hypothetical protein